MNKKIIGLAIVVSIVFHTTSYIISLNKNNSKQVVISAIEEPRIEKEEIVDEDAPSPTITTKYPYLKSYPEIVKQIKEWEYESPYLTKVGVLGQTRNKTDVYFLKIANEMNKIKDKPKILMTACIHGNEPHAAMTMLWHVGEMLSNYGKDPIITKLLNTREIYFVPVVSPDSYMRSRYSENVDPNRDFPNPFQLDRDSKASSKNLQKFFLEIKPNAVISGHTWGRVYLYPNGYSLELAKDDDEYKRIVGKMAELSRYRAMKLTDFYRGGNSFDNPPIQTAEYPVEIALRGVPLIGTELDWYYYGGDYKNPTHGAFAIICEFGTHQRMPTKNEILSEHLRTYKAFLYFFEEAPIVNLKINNPE